MENGEAAYSCLTDAACAFVEEVCRTAEAHPEAVEPFRGDIAGINGIFSRAGLKLFPTVERTTLVASGCGRYFLKILHALTFKERMKNLVLNRAEAIHRLSEKLRAGGVNAPEVEAWGTFYKNNRRFFVMQKVSGESLYDVAVRKGRREPVETYLRVMDELIKLHALGYLMGDAHPSHVFITEGRVTGIIDIDGMRRNHPFGLRGIARDLAGLNHPGLLLDEAGRAAIFGYYVGRSGIRAGGRFYEYFKTCTESRWKRQA
jgi:hypothetical protein